MMKTPEGIKKGLVCCGSDNDCLPSFCPYYHECLFEDEYILQKDALAYIQQLEAELEAIKLQRDMAIERYNRMKETAAILSDAVTELEEEIERDGR